MSDNWRPPQDPSGDDDGFASPSSNPDDARDTTNESTDATTEHHLGGSTEHDETRQHAAANDDAATDQPWANPDPAQHFGARADGGEWTKEDKKRRNGGFMRTVALVVVAALIGAGTATLINNNTDSAGGTPTRSDSTETASQASDTEATPNNIRSVLEKVQPAVVTISVTTANGTGNGTGMIVSSDGEILTNNHVVAGANRIQVTLDNETEPRTARLLGADTTIDTALIKIDGSNLPTVEFGDSAGVQVGDEVVAIGNALALTGGPSVTSGIISAKDRSISDSSASLSNLLQTDTAINPGNSGGPLVNMEGQVVGVNTAVIRGDTGEFENIGFALSINTVQPAIADLRNGVSRQPAYLGLNPVTLDDSIRERYDLTPETGVVISQVQQDSPADQAGLSRFDVITSIDGDDVTTSDALINYIRGKQPNDRVEITFYRGDDEQTVTATLAARPSTTS